MKPKKKNSASSNCLVFNNFHQTEESDCFIRLVFIHLLFTFNIHPTHFKLRTPNTVPKTVTEQLKKSDTPTMKTRTPLRLIQGLMILAMTGLVISSCKKTSTTTDSDTSSSNENAFAEARYNEAGSISDQAAAGGVSSYRLNPNANNGSLLSNCAVLTFDTINHTNPDSIEVNFGTTNCLCHDGRYRRGIIYITYTKPHYWDSLDVITLSFSNYFVDDYGISGVKTITNEGRISGQQTYNSTVVNGMITKPTSAGGGSYTYNANITRKWTGGENTPFFWLDDVYQFTGQSNGVSSTGTGYTAVIITPLVYEVACPEWFVQGILDFTPSGKPTRVIDYGTGACDNIAIVTINGTPYTVHMW
jgi:hypothetical protein